MNYVNEELFYEKLGIWCYSSDVNDYKTTHAETAEYIYTFTREKIISELNKNQNLKIIKFSIPNNLLEIPVNLKNGNKTIKKLLPLSIIYNVNSDENNDAMYIDIFSPKCNINLIINISIFNSSFKSIFLHELKHCWQTSFEADKFSNWITYENIQNIENIEYKEVAKKIFDVLYYLNPDEFSSYRENIYSYAYNLYVKNQNQTINEILKNIKTHYNYINKNINDIKDIQKKYNVDFEKYILSLLFFNLEKIKKGKYKYNLFSAKQAHVISELIIRLTSLNITNNKNVISSIINTLIQQSPDFVKDTCDNVIKNLENNLNQYNKKINKIVYQAVCDAKKDIKKAEIGYYNYISENPNKTINIEVLLYNKKDRYIAILTDIDLDNIVSKLYILYILYKNNFSIKFVFKELNPISKSVNKDVLNTYISKLKNYPAFNNKKDFKKIIDFINELKF